MKIASLSIIQHKLNNKNTEFGYKSTGQSEDDSHRSLLRKLYMSIDKTTIPSIASFKR